MENKKDEKDICKPDNFQVYISKAASCFIFYVSFLILQMYRMTLRTFEFTCLLEISSKPVFFYKP